MLGFSITFAVSWGVCSTHLACLRVWATRLLSQWMLR